MKYIIYFILLTNTIFAIAANEYVNHTNCDQIIDKTFYKVCYDYSLKATKAVSYTLQGDLVNELNIKERPYFYSEKVIPAAYRAYYKDYKNSSYDRGHIAPDAAFDWSQESLDATYSLSNIMPQARKVNRYTWTKAERYARFVAVQRGNIHVINILTYDDIPLRIGSHSIAVPSGYYKVLYSADQTYTRCLYYANDNAIDTSEDKLRDHDIDCSEVPGQKKIDYSFLIPILMLNQ